MPPSTTALCSALLFTGGPLHSHPTPTLLLPRLASPVQLPPASFLSSPPRARLRDARALVRPLSDWLTAVPGLHHLERAAAAAAVQFSVLSIHTEHYSNPLSPPHTNHHPPPHEHRATEIEGKKYTVPAAVPSSPTQYSFGHLRNLIHLVLPFHPISTHVLRRCDLFRFHHFYCTTVGDSQPSQPARHPSPHPSPRPPI